MTRLLAPIIFCSLIINIQSVSTDGVLNRAKRNFGILGGPPGGIPGGIGGPGFGGPGFGGAPGGLFGGFGGFNTLFYDPNRISDCPTTEYNRTGVCVTSQLECRSKGGRVVGQCYTNPISGSGTSGGQFQDLGNDYNRRIPIGVCCIYQVTCGGTVLQNGTFFRSPNSPATYNDMRECSVTIPRITRGICQIRLDFISFQLKPPTGGVCDVDKLIIDGQAQNNVIPALCGHNAGQHIYLDVERGNNPVTVTVLTGTGQVYNRQFDIRVTYIPCLSPYRAPHNCLQYYYNLHGEFRSFGFDYNPNAKYLKDLDYAVCFRKLPGFCSISYSMPAFGVQAEQDSGGATQVRPVGRFFNIVNELGAGIGMGGSGPVKCPGDYLVLNSQKFCGNVLFDDPERGSSPSQNQEIVDNGSGPLIARFHTNDDDMIGVGFNLRYRLNHCFFGGRK